jgi:hypothetical protein
MRRLIWPASVVVASLISALAAHHFSKEHYLQLGKDLGSIDARIAMVKEIDAALPSVRTCTDGDYRSAKEVVSVKSWAVFVKPIDGSSVAVCRAH